MDDVVGTRPVMQTRRYRAIINRGASMVDVGPNVVIVHAPDRPSLPRVAIYLLPPDEATEGITDPPPVPLLIFHEDEAKELALDLLSVAERVRMGIL